MPVDWEAFCVDLLTLLDRIECESDEQETWELTRQRHDLAEKHGLKVEVGPQISPLVQ